jgi:uncharacterized protein YndB with AHSA1/START domain
MKDPAALSRSIQASGEAVYRAFTTSLGLQDWCADAAGLDLRPGGHLFLWAETGYRLLGSVSRLEADECVDWEGSSPQPFAIRIRIAPEKGGSLVSMSFDAEGDLETHLAFWDPALDNLKAVLETGLDRRVYDRPMLGILIGDMLDAEKQAKYGTPVPHGIILSGTLPGMGAEALGLAENDVVVEMGDVQLKHYHAIRDALSGCKAGDRIQVVWYRGAERMSGSLRLSGRPEPFIPATPAELAEYTRGIIDRLDSELAEILDGATEEEADYRPAEKEWSIKEIIAHTIASERANQAWIVSALDGHYLKDVSSNAHSLVRSIVDVLPTLPELTAELHRTESQTVAMIRRLPPEIVEHKGVYTDIATLLGEHGVAVHTRTHYENIRTQLEALRSIKR